MGLTDCETFLSILPSHPLLLLSRNYFKDLQELFRNSRKLLESKSPHSKFNSHNKLSPPLIPRLITIQSMDFSKTLPGEAWKQILTSVADLDQSFLQAPSSSYSRWNSTPRLNYRPSSAAALTCAQFYDLVSPLRFSSFTIDTGSSSAFTTRNGQALEEKIDFLVKNPKICNQVKKVTLINCKKAPIPHSFWSKLLPRLKRVQHLDINGMNFELEPIPAKSLAMLLKQTARTLKRLTIFERDVYGLSSVMELMPQLKKQLRLSEMEIKIDDPNAHLPCDEEFISDPYFELPSYFYSKATNKSIPREEWDVWEIVRIILDYPKDFQNQGPTRSMSHQLARLKENNFNYDSDLDYEEEEEEFEVDFNNSAEGNNNQQSNYEEDEDDYEDDDEGLDTSKGVLRFSLYDVATCNALSTLSSFIHQIRLPSHFTGLPDACCEDSFEYRISVSVASTCQKACLPTIDLLTCIIYELSQMLQDYRVYLDEDVEVGQFLSYE